eukprot:TRINITY_DN8439_c0_g3_i1.p1 TRINITY_DN8439_c0_g3~~TRINITY_DN8439_c0_g3_i1.p1  ORF type:complete len:357 (+),score=68.70 TRINITY_DN8439_c0_g3_i1:237-1307(+)
MAGDKGRSVKPMEIVAKSIQTKSKLQNKAAKSMNKMAKPMKKSDKSMNISGKPMIKSGKPMIKSGKPMKKAKITRAAKTQGTCAVFVEPKNWKSTFVVETRCVDEDVCVDDDDLDGSSSLDSFDLSDKIQRWDAWLHAPYAKCWSKADAQKMFPALTDEQYLNGRYRIGSMHTLVAPQKLMEYGTKGGDWQTVFLELDNYTDSFYNMMNACTNVEGLSVGEAASSVVYRSLPAKLEALQKKAGRNACVPMLSIDRLIIEDARFRGLGYGSKLVNEGLAGIADGMPNYKNCVAYVKPFPFQWGSFRMNQAPKKNTLMKDTKAIFDFYKQLGFKPVEGSKNGGLDSYKHGYLVRAAAQ